MSSNQCAINMDNNGDQDRLQQVTQQTQAMAVYDNTVRINNNNNTITIKFKAKQMHLFTYIWYKL